MIVFGYNSFVIKSITPEEAGLPPSEGDNYRIEVRQRYFHLFWIPFFPIGKIWGLKRAGDQNLYTIPYEIDKVVKENVSVGTPWYSFALVFVAMFIGLIVFLNDLQSKQNREDYFYNSLAESKMMIQYPTTGDFYTFKHYETSEKRNSKSILLKVKQYDDTKIQFNSIEEDLYTQPESYYNLKMQKIYLQVESNDFNPTYIDKEVLTSMLRKEYKSYAQKPIKIPNLDGYFVLSEIERMPLE